MLSSFISKFYRFLFIFGTLSYRMSRNWSRWEQVLRSHVKQSDILKQLNEHKQLNAHEDSQGRITYSKVADKKSFNSMSDIVVNMVPRASIYKIPSIARLLSRDAHVYPWYYVQFSSIEPDDFDYTQSVTSDRPSLEEVLDHLREGEPMIGICILENKHIEMYHGIAFITWKHGSRYKFAYYDPIAYQRKKKRANGEIYYANYDYARIAFQSEHFDIDIDFMDLSQFCLKKSEDEYHCPQYMIDAEYCYMNSLFFLYQWVHYGKPIHMSGLRAVIESCYIVDPSRLTRANTHESMIYRVIMMSFILTSLYRYFNMLTITQQRLLGEEAVHGFMKRIICFSVEWNQQYGFYLIQPSLVRNPKNDSRKVVCLRTT